MFAALDPVLSPNPRKRAVEKFWLAYTPVWGVISAIVMIGGFGERWGDLELMIYGATLGLAAAIGPVVFRPAEDRDVPFWRSTAFSMSVAVVIVSFGLNYTQTPYFWDVLHMHYGFRVSILIDDNPVFLYLLTIAYFATYSALTMMTLRAIRRALSGSPVVANVLGFSLAPLAMAFLETAMNANPFTTRLFCYDDMRLMLWFGTLSYGIAFIFALPMWYFIDEFAERVRVPVATVLVWGAAGLYGDLLALDLLRYHVAPHVTVVEEGARNMGDFGEGCLPALTDQAPISGGN